MFRLFFAQIFILWWKWQQIDEFQRLAAAAKHIGDRRRQKRDGPRLAILSFNPLFGK
jgi:hypothetical protein